MIVFGFRCAYILWLLAFVTSVAVVTKVPPSRDVYHPAIVYPAFVGAVVGSLYFTPSITLLLAGLTPVPPFWSYVTVYLYCIMYGSLFVPLPVTSVLPGKYNTGFNPPTSFPFCVSILLPFVI